MYKKHFNKEEGCKKPFAILEKQMLFVGKMRWVLHSEYSTAQERNEVLAKLKQEHLE